LEDAKLLSVPLKTTGITLDEDGGEALDQDIFHTAGA